MALQVQLHHNHEDQVRDLVTLFLKETQRRFKINKRIGVRKGFYQVLLLRLGAELVKDCVFQLMYHYEWDDLHHRVVNSGILGHVFE